MARDNDFGAIISVWRLSFAAFNAISHIFAFVNNVSIYLMFFALLLRHHLPVFKPNGALIVILCKMTGQLSAFTHSNRKKKYQKMYIFGYHLRKRLSILHTKKAAVYNCQVSLKPPTKTTSSGN